MKKFLKWLPMLVLAIMTSLSFVSCHEDDEEDEVSVGMSSVSLVASGGSQSVPVASNTQWMVSGAPSWLSVSPMQGSKNGAFSISADKNEDSKERSCMLVITAGKASAMVEVKQSGNTQSAIVGVWEERFDNGSFYEVNRWTFYETGKGNWVNRAEDYSGHGISEDPLTFSYAYRESDGTIRITFDGDGTLFSGTADITGSTLILRVNGTYYNCTRK